MDAIGALGAIISGRTLTREEARATMASVMAGGATPAQLGALLATLHLRGETVDEIVGFAEAMKAAAVPVTLGVTAVDIVGALGVKIDLGPDEAARCIDEVGLAFLFAPRYHPAMRHASPVRREIRIRTVFNILGPISNPAGVRRMVLGVATPQVGESIARSLGELGADHVLVVHGEDGLDDISPTGPTRTWELRGGAVTTGSIDPA